MPHGAWRMALSVFWFPVFRFPVFSVSGLRFPVAKCPAIFLLAIFCLWIPTHSLIVRFEQKLITYKLLI